MSRIAFCEACNAIEYGIKSRVAFEHTCGLQPSEWPEPRKIKTWAERLAEEQAKQKQLLAATNNNPNNQLPDEVVEEITQKANAKYNEHGLIRMISRREGFKDGATEYAAKLHQVQQEKEEERRQRVYLEMENDVITDNYNKAQQEIEAACSLLETVLAFIPGTETIHDKIQTFLDGTK